MQLSSVSISGGLRSPRSAAEEYEFQFGELVSKYRQLPCKSFIIAGTCPYRDRCDYVHDPRCFSKAAKGKTKKRNEEGTILDSFYWPNLSQAFLCRPREKFRPDVVVQKYQIPEPQHDKYYLHDSALFSLWNHFAEFCSRINDGKSDEINNNVIPLSRNRFTGRLRLKVFEDLSHGQSPTIRNNPSTGSLITINRVKYEVNKLNNNHQSVVTSQSVATTTMTLKKESVVTDVNSSHHGVMQISSSIPSPAQMFVQMPIPINKARKSSFDDGSAEYLDYESGSDCSVSDSSPRIPTLVSGILTPSSVGSNNGDLYDYYRPDELYTNISNTLLSVSKDKNNVFNGQYRGSNSNNISNSYNRW